MTKLKISRWYVVSLLFRLALIVFADYIGFGYIHPDEHLQIVDPLAILVRPYAVARIEWDYFAQLPGPVRSWIFPMLYSLVPSFGTSLITRTRLASLFISAIAEISLMSLPSISLSSTHLSKDVWERAVMLAASSWPFFVFTVRPFVNTLEAAALLLAISTIVRAATATTVCTCVTLWSLLGLLVGSICWVRPSFLAFAPGLTAFMLALCAARKDDCSCSRSSCSTRTTNTLTQAPLHCVGLPATSHDRHESDPSGACGGCDAGSGSRPESKPPPPGSALPHPLHGGKHTQCAHQSWRTRVLAAVLVVAVAATVAVVVALVLDTLMHAALGPVIAPYATLHAPLPALPAPPSPIPSSRLPAAISTLADPAPPLAGPASAFTAVHPSVPPPRHACPAAPRPHTSPFALLDAALSQHTLRDVPGLTALAAALAPLGEAFNAVLSRAQAWATVCGRALGRLLPLPATHSLRAALFSTSLPRLSHYLAALPLAIWDLPLLAAPLRFLAYNADARYTALHGLHSRLTHLCVNMPLLFLPLLVRIAIACLGSRAVPASVVGHTTRGTGTTHAPLLRVMRRQPLLSALLLLLLVPLVLLSLAPHQEPRFLFPLLWPLALTAALLEGGDVDKDEGAGARARAPGGHGVASSAGDSAGTHSGSCADDRADGSTWGAACVVAGGLSYTTYATALGKDAAPRRALGEGNAIPERGAAGNTSMAYVAAAAAAGGQSAASYGGPVECVGEAHNPAGPPLRADPAHVYDDAAVAMNAVDAAGAINSCGSGGGGGSSNHSTHAPHASSRSAQSAFGSLARLPPRRGWLRALTLVHCLVLFVLFHVLHHAQHTRALNVAPALAVAVGRERTSGGGRRSQCTALVWHGTYPPTVAPMGLSAVHAHTAAFTGTNSGTVSMGGPWCGLRDGVRVCVADSGGDQARLRSFADRAHAWCAGAEAAGSRDMESIETSDDASASVAIDSTHGGRGNDGRDDVVVVLVQPGAIPVEWAGAAVPPCTPTKPTMPIVPVDTTAIERVPVASARVADEASAAVPQPSVSSRNGGQATRPCWSPLASLWPHLTLEHPGSLHLRVLRLRLP